MASFAPTLPLPTPPQYHEESESPFPLKLENRTAFGAKNESIFSKLSGGFMGLICIHPPSLGVCLPIYIGFGAAGHKDNG